MPVEVHVFVDPEAFRKRDTGEIVFPEGGTPVAKILTSDAVGAAGEALLITKLVKLLSISAQPEVGLPVPIV